MSAPQLPPLAQEVYDACGPLRWQEDEPTVDYALARYCGALASPLEELASLARDSDEGPGWSALLDPVRCPAWALPWLAQFVGVTIRAPATPAEEATARQLITDHPGFQRGTPLAIEQAVALTLSGTRSVRLTERSGGSAYQLLIATLTAETPNAAATTAAAKAAVPAGIVVTVSVTAGAIWQDVLNHGTWTAHLAARPTWEDTLERP